MRVDIFESKNADAVGEWLRSYVFDCKEGEYGCYSCFELIPEFIEVGNKETRIKLVKILYGDYIYEIDKETMDEYNKKGSYYENNDIYVCWYWEGDGTLAFVNKKSGNGVINTDCKKDHGWEWM